MHRLAVIVFAMSSANAQVQSADRMVAEWTLRMGGSVILEGQRRPVTDLPDLPSADFRIHTLNLTSVTSWVLRAQGMNCNACRLCRI